MNGNGGAILIPRPPFRLYRGPVLWGIYGALFATLAALAFVLIHPDHAAAVYGPLAAAAALMFAAWGVSVAWYFGFGGTLRVDEDGVQLNGRSIRYADIENLTIRETPRYNGEREVVGLNRTITLNDVRVRYIVSLDDALNQAMRALIQRVAEEPRHSGEGWTLDRDTLHWRGEIIPLQSIASFAVHDEELRAWRGDEEQHFFAAPLDSKNALVLLHAMEQRVPAGRSDGNSPAALPLGRLLFTRRTSATVVILGTALILALLYAVTFAPIGNLGRGALLALAALTILRATWLLTTRYHFHERAITRTTLLGSRTLRHDDIASMTWREYLRYLHEGKATGVRLSATLVPKDGSRPLRLKLRRFRHADADVALVLGELAEQVEVQCEHRRPQ